MKKGKVSKMIKVSQKDYKDILEKVGKEKIEQNTITDGKASADRQIQKSKKKLSGSKQIKQNTDDIIQLHNGIVNHLTQSLVDAIRIGELLFEQKKLIKYGEFSSWTKDNLPFSIRTAQRYMKLFQYKEALTEEGVSSITDAYHHIFDEPVSDEVIEVDDGLATDYPVITQKEDINEMPVKLPKKKQKGQFMELALGIDNVDDFIDKNWSHEHSQEQYSKIVVPFRGRVKAVDEVKLGLFVLAAQKYLRPGGKLIFYKE